MKDLITKSKCGAKKPEWIIIIIINDNYQRLLPS